MDDESKRLIDRLGIFWHVIVNLEENTHNEVRDDFPETLFSPIVRWLWKCEKLCWFWKHSSPLVPMMAALPHLHFPDGALLDYYQSGYRTGSYPKLYVRKPTIPRLPNNADTCLGASMSGVKVILDSVQPDFTPDGVWELILLMTLGEQFNLVWHAGTKERKIVYDMEGFFSGRYFEYEFGTENVHFFNAKALTEKDKQELLSWQTSPKVELKQDSASVEFCMFKPFGGFFMIQNQIQFKPHLKMMAPVIMKKVYYPLQFIY